MKLRGLSTAFMVVLALLLVQPSFGVEPSAAPESDAAALLVSPEGSPGSEVCDPAAADAASFELPNPLQDAFEAAGCTASYNCVHGTLISCSSPVNGSCSASGARCGAVTCSGTTTWCPGSCRTDIHCWSFCPSGGTCDWAGCCDCF